MNIIDIPNELLIPSQKAFNCSIVEFDNRTHLFYRFENLRGDYNTDIAVCELDKDFMPILGTNVHLRRLARWSSKVTTLDDPRAFIFNRRMMVIYPQGMLVLRPEGWTWCCSVALAEFDGKYNILGQWLPDYGKNINASSRQSSSLIAGEKNWSPFVYNGRMMLIYKINPLTIIECTLTENGIHTEEVCKNEKIDQSFWKYGDFLGGGTPLLRKGNEYVGFFHSFTEDHPNMPHARRYHVGFYSISCNPPFRLLRVSKKPILSAQFDDIQDLRGTSNKWRPNCVYPCGFIERDNKIYLSAGWQDCRCKIYEFTWTEINKKVTSLEKFETLKK